MNSQFNSSYSLLDLIKNGSVQDVKKSLDQRYAGHAVTRFVVWNALMLDRFDVAKMCVNDPIHGAHLSKEHGRLLLDLVVAGNLVGLKFMMESEELIQPIDPSVVDQQTMSICAFHRKGGDILRYLLPKINWPAPTVFEQQKGCETRFLISEIACHGQADVGLAMIEMYGASAVLPFLKSSPKFIDEVFALAPKSIRHTMAKKALMI